METVKLYYENAFLREFDGVVVDCRPQGKKWLVILDQTAFYPEGGGQPADHGILGGAKVTDVHERDGVILHTCDRALPEGKTVHGEIDWPRRFDHMQQHSGEHIVSGMLCAAYNCDNTGFHLGEGSVIIDYNADIPWEGVLDIEARANRYIWENHSLVTLYPTAQELAALPYRSKKELTGQVRIVTIPGADICACCGTHVSSTGEIGLIKIFSCVKFHDGVRLEILCGRRALAYLSEIAEQNRRVSGLLSAKPLETAAAVRRLLDAEAAQKQRAASLEETVFAQKAQALAGAGNVLLFEPAMNPDSLRRLTDLVMSACGGRAAVFAGSDADGYKYAVGEQDGDLRQLVKELNAQLHGRGGGKPFFAQGSVQAGRAEIEVFFAGR